MAIRRIDGGNCFHISKVIRDVYEELAIKNGKTLLCVYKQVS